MKTTLINIGLRIFFTLLFLTFPVWGPAILIISGFFPQRKRDEWDKKANAMSGLV